MDRKLYSVKVVTELMVLAKDVNEANKVAKLNAPKEVEVYGETEAKVVNYLSDIPKDWKEVMPYVPEGAVQETKKCSEIVGLVKESKKNEDIDVQEIVRIQKGKVESKGKSVEEVMPETRADPKPKELDWRETTSGRSMPHLKFKIPSKP